MRTLEERRMDKGADVILMIGAVAVYLLACLGQLVAAYYVVTVMTDATVLERSTRLAAGIVLAFTGVVLLVILCATVMVAVQGVADYYKLWCVRRARRKESHAAG